MKRIHALEWEDLRWFPGSWRDYGTDYLRFIAIRFDMYNPILSILKKGLDASGNQAWVDCASGGGGGLIKLARELKKEYPNLKIFLTDYYPNAKAFERTLLEDSDVFRFESQSVNAMDLPAHLQNKFRTLFGAFHHFRPDDARGILQNAVDTNSPIAIFEPVGKNVMSCVSMLFVILNVLLFTYPTRAVAGAAFYLSHSNNTALYYVGWCGFYSTDLFKKGTSNAGVSIKQFKQV